ncbi:Alpha/beta hydrolase fold-containing [Candidatus Magnetomoraceae bacterium gMMP-15]
MTNSDNPLNKKNFSKDNLTITNSIANQMNAPQNYWIGITNYLNGFMVPYMNSINYFTEAEQSKLTNGEPMTETFQSYLELLDFNFDISSRNFTGSMKALADYSSQNLKEGLAALFNTLLNADGENIEEFISRQARMIKILTNDYPKAIQDIKSEYGFHFESGKNIKFAETDRFILYKILPTDKSVKINENAKPIIIIPPYVLGANILAFLPGENRSYTHCFANKGIPTYIRVMKDIHKNEAVQLTTCEDDILDTRLFCEKVKAAHGKPVTLNGYCQGGFSTVCGILSGKLDGLVDSLITCVSPMEGTQSQGFVKFFKDLPRRFNDLDYGSKTLPNGNKVADGDLMGWVYKLKSIENEAPMVSFCRDLMMFGKTAADKNAKINKTAAAINYWLNYERTDLPLGITKMSFDSYNTPVADDGTLPVTVFGQKLNFKRIQEKGIKWLICYGEKDDLVEKETALAPLRYIDAEISPFPKGHVAIATSWSDPKSKCALDKHFGKGNHRGPVRFQLDLDKELDDKKSSLKKGD